MSILFARDSEDLACPFKLPFCSSSNTLGPGPAMNAAAMESVQYSDPTLRDPNAALDRYNRHIAPEMILGGIFVGVLVFFALGLWIALDSGLRARLKRWMRCGARRKEVAAPNSPGGRSDLTRVNTRVDDDVERAMKMPLNRSSVSRMPSPLRQTSTEGKAEESAAYDSRDGQTVPMLPALSLSAH